MSLITWQPDFATGDLAIDNEHRELIALINLAHDNIHQRQTDQVIIDCLGEVFAQISAHFALEEKFMRESNYAEYAAHKEDHERLLDSLRDIMDAVEDYGVFDEDQLSGELKEWFVNHFNVFDAKLHART